MVSRRDFYTSLIDDAARDTSTPLDEVFTELFRDVDGRLTDVEDKAASLDQIKQTAVATVLAYTGEQLAPEFDRVRVLADLGLLFEAGSTTSLTVSTGSKVVVIDEADRGRFSPAGFVGLMKVGDPGVFMAGPRVSYDRASGQLVVDVTRTAGGGTATAWKVVAVSGTDYAAAAGEAATHATDAETAAAEALGHKTATQGFRDETETFKDLAESARTDAVAAKVAAEAAEVAAGEHLDGVQTIADRYLPAAAANPTTRPGGGALQEGDLYWNTVSKEMRTYNGTAWTTVYVPASAAVSSWNGRVGGVNPADGDYNAGQVSVSPTVLGANRVQAALTALAAALDTKLNTSAATAFALTLLDDANAAAARTTLGVPATAHSHAWADITSGVPAILSALAALTGAAAKGMRLTGTGSAETFTLSDFALTLLDDADAATMLATLGAAAANHNHPIATALASGFLSASDKAKLDGIQTGATNYAHPSGDGNQHVPATGTGNNRRVLMAGSTAGSASWTQPLFSDIGSVPGALSGIGGLTAAAKKGVRFTGASAAELIDISDFALSFLDDADAAAVRTTLGAAANSHIHTAADLPIASAAQFRAKTLSRVLDTGGVWDAAATAPVAYAASIALDLGAAFNFELNALTGALTLANPTNAKVGQSGFVRIPQDGVGGRTISWGTFWGFSGAKPALTTTAGGVDFLFYTVVASNLAVCSLVKGVA